MSIPVDQNTLYVTGLDHSGSITPVSKMLLSPELAGGKIVDLSPLSVLIVSANGSKHQKVDISFKNSIPQLNPHKPVGWDMMRSFILK